MVPRLHQNLALQGLPLSVAGGGCFLGFFASLVLRCCPLAMIVLLIVFTCWKMWSLFRIKTFRCHRVYPGSGNAQRAGMIILHREMCNIFLEFFS